jgi:hypothetical protein
MTVPATGGAMWATLEEQGVISRRALRLPDHISESEMTALGVMFSDVDDTSRFLLGDLLVAATSRYGDDFAVSVMEATGLSLQSCNNLASICRRVQPNVRRQELRFHTHAVVAPLEPSEQKRLLKLAVDNQWTRQKLRDEVYGEKVLPPVVTDDLEQVARDLLAGAKQMMDGWLISRDSYQRLRAALGETDG